MHLEKNVISSIQPLLCEASIVDNASDAASFERVQACIDQWLANVSENFPIYGERSDER
jgi:hypothetical protein